MSAKKEVWWGWPDLNRRPLPNDGAKPKFTGFSMTAPEIRHSPRGVSKPVVCLLSGARRHTCLDYDPTVLGSDH